MSDNLTFQVVRRSDGKRVLQVIPPETPKTKASLDVCIVIDTSGSMGDAANPNAAEGINLFSKMDLAKRGAEVVARALGANDTLTIYGFSSQVSGIMERTAMDKTGLLKALGALAGMHPGGCTALWDGLYAGLYEMEVFQPKDTNRIPVVIILTDGLPSPSPPAGEVNALNTYIATKRHSVAKLVTIGFGYDVNSKLLVDLANAHGPGNEFLFIPDGTMLLTNFVNMLANLQSICARQMMVGGKNIGDVLYGQTRCFVIDHMIEGVPVIENDDAVTRELLRHMAIEAMEKAITFAPVDLDNAQKFVKDCAMAILTSNPDLPILGDLAGEVSTALASMEAWKRWGSHYLRSLVCAHKAQVCTNFKDTGLLAYGGQFTREKRETLSAMCDGLPVPVPSIKPHTSSYGGYGTPVASANGPITIAAFRDAFNNANGGCVAQNTLIAMADGSSKPIQDLKKGDLVVVPVGSTAKVVCVVMCKDVGTVRLEDCLDITPWHPVKMGGRWAFPANLVTTQTLTLQANVYTLVLDGGHVVLANGIEMVTLGHGFEEEVVKHYFYGTTEVIEALKDLNPDAFESGFIELGNHGIPVMENDKMVGFTEP